MVDHINRYMQMKLEADRRLALHVDKTAVALGDVVESTLDSIGMGAKRLLWRTSYFFDGYEDVNAQINHEDYRLYLAMLRLAEGENVVSEMTEVFINELFKGQDEKATGRIYIKLLGASAKIATSKTTKQAMALAISDAVCYSLLLNSDIKKKIAKSTAGILTVLQTYGRV